MSGSIKRKVLQAPKFLEFKVPCAFNGQMSEVEVYLGDPESKRNPIFFQSKFISDTKGGVIPDGVLESLEKLKILAAENGVNFVDLCKEALTSMATNDGNIPSEGKEEINDEARGDLLALEETKTSDSENKSTEANKVTESEELSNNSITTQKDSLDNGLPEAAEVETDTDLMQ